jgi:integrase
MDKTEVIKQHIDFKKTSITSQDKLKDIERYISKFINSNKKKIEEFGEPELNSFVASLQSKYSIQSVNAIKVYLKVFIKWFFADYSIRFRNLDRICKNQKAPKTYTAEQMLKESDIKKLIDGEQEIMWKVFLMVYFYGGFRPLECAKLKWENVLFLKEGIIIKSFSTKTRKHFFKSLPEEAEHYLKEWRKLNNTELLFPSPIHLGKTIAKKTFYFRLRALSEKVLGKRINPYLLRHSFATIKYNDDSLKEDIVAEQLGHNKNMKSTYMNLSEEKMIINSRKIYAKIDLPEEKKHALETQIDKQNKEIVELKQDVKTLAEALGIYKKTFDKIEPLFLSK